MSSINSQEVFGIPSVIIKSALTSSYIFILSAMDRKRLQSLPPIKLFRRVLF